MQLRSTVLNFLLFGSLVINTAATEIKSLKQNGTCRYTSLDPESSYLKGFNQVDVMQESGLLVGCAASNIKDPNFIIFVKNSAENKVYLTFSNAENDQQKAKPHRIVLASILPTTWIIYQLDTGNVTYNYYVYPGSVVINGDTGMAISKITMGEEFNPGWIDIQLKVMLEKTVFNGHVKGYIEFQRADFVNINLGSELPESQSCNIQEAWKPPNDLIRASYLESVIPHSTCSLLDSDIENTVQFLVEVNNRPNRLKSDMSLWLSGVESLKSGAELIVVLATAHPVAWVVVTPFNIPTSCNLRFEISAGSSLSDDNIALVDGTSQKVSYFQPMPYGNNESGLLTKMNAASTVQSFARFDHSVDFIELKLPQKPMKPTPELPTVDEIYLFMGDLKLYCRNEICELTIPSETYKALNLLETQIRIGNQECEIEMNEEDEEFISDEIEVGSCGLVQTNSSYVIGVVLFVEKKFKFSVSTPVPPEPKMAVYTDLNRSEKLQSPILYYTAQQESFYVEISMENTELSNGINLDQCYLYVDSGNSNPLYLIYQSCPVNKNVGMMLLTYCPGDVHQKVFTFSQDLLLSFPDKDVSLACHVTACDTVNYSLCQNSDIESCSGVMDYKHDYTTMESDYLLQVGIFRKAKETTGATNEPKKQETEFNFIKPSIVIFIGFCTFFIGIVLMIVLWSIHLHYQKKKQTYTNKFNDRMNYDSLRTSYDTMNKNRNMNVEGKGGSQAAQGPNRIPGLKTNGQLSSNSKAEEEVTLPLLSRGPQTPLTPSQSDSSGEGDGGYSSNGKSKSGSLSAPHILGEIAYMKEDVV